MVATHVLGSAANPYRYRLTVAGVDVTPYTPLDTAHVQMTLAGPGGTSQMSFTVEDPTGAVALPDGAYTTLRDLTNPTGLGFTGILINRRVRRGDAGQGTVTDCIVVGVEWYLGKSYIPAKKSKTDTAGRIQLLSKDDVMVKAILSATNVGLADLATGTSSIQQTQTSMDPTNVGDSMVQDALDQVADIAQPSTSSSVRHWYIDDRGKLHYYSGAEGLVPPFRVADSSYLTKLLAVSGLKALWTGRVASSTTLVDELNYATATLTGGYTQNVASLCLNEMQLPAVTLDGTTGYASATGANLHPGNTWTVGIVFRRGSIGAAQTLVSAGAGDYYIGFDASDHLIVQLEGTGNNFVSGSTYSSTSLTYHVVVTRSPTGSNGTHVYVNGTDITSGGTTTNRVFAAAAGAVNIGRKLSTTNLFFTGTWWGAFVSSAELSASSVAALCNQWRSIVPEGMLAEYDSSNVVQQVYIKGSTAVGTGWHQTSVMSLPSLFGSNGFPPPNSYLDQPDSDTRAKRAKFGNAYLSVANSPALAVSFSWTGDPNWVLIAGAQTTPRQGQTMLITDSALGFSAYSTEVKQVDVDLNMGNGVATFDVTAGALPPSGLRSMRGRSGSPQANS